jgi:hypothetical protein
MFAVVTIYDFFVAVAILFLAAAVVLRLWGRRIALWLLERIARRMQREFVKAQNLYQDVHKHSVREIQLTPNSKLTIPVENESYPPDDPKSYADRATDADFEEMDT